MAKPFTRLRAGGDSKEILGLAKSLAVRTALPPRDEFAALTAEVLDILRNESTILRPPDQDEAPGGLLDLPDLPVILLPDLHARADFLAQVLAWRPPLFAAGIGKATLPGQTLAALLEREAAVLVCLGDAFHSEGEAAARRWMLALKEYEEGWERSPAMDEEMGRALACVELILCAKRAFPASFHYLKGNHDNITDEEGRGDHPFYKYALEGEMTASWFALRYGVETLSLYRQAELSLPLVVRGSHFIASHAEPAFAMTARDIIEYRRRPEVAEALTWTPNDAAATGSVARTMASLLGPAASASRWFAGHRPVEGLFALRSAGLFVQFHNPRRHVIVMLRPGVRPDPETSILELP